MKRVIIATAVIGLVLGAAPILAGAGQEKVLICHVTGSETNPYEVIEVAEPAWLNAHQDHGDFYAEADLVALIGDEACEPSDDDGSGGGTEPPAEEDHEGMIFVDGEWIPDCGDTCG